MQKYLIAGAVGVSLLFSNSGVMADEKKQSSLENLMMKERAMDVRSIRKRIQLIHEPLERYVENTDLYKEISAMKKKKIDESFGEKLVELYQKVQGGAADEKIINKIY